MIKARMKNFAMVMLALVTVLCFSLGVATFSGKTALAAGTDNLSGYTETSNADGSTTYKWDFVGKVSSNTNVGDYKANNKDDNGLTYESAKRDKVKYKSEYLSFSSGGKGKVYIPVPADTEGTLKSISSDEKPTRMITLLVGGTTLDTTRSLLCSKTEQSFNYTAADVAKATVNGVEGNYLVLQENGDGEVKISSFTLIARSLGGKVTYDANNGATAVPTDDTFYKKGTNALAAAMDVANVKVGYEFTGWNTKADGTGTAVAAGAEVLVDGDMTLYAQYNIAIASFAPIDVKTVVSADIISVHGLELPESVVAVDLSGNNVTLAVTWDTTAVETAITADGLAVGQYTIDGTVTGTVKNPVAVENSKVSITVNCIASKKVIQSFNALEAVNVYVDETVDAVVLPTKVTAVVDGAEEELALGNWNTAAFNSAAVTVDPLVFTAEAVYDNNIYNIACANSIALNVNVVARKLVSCEPVRMNFKVGGTVALPETVKVTVEKLNEVQELPVVWNATELAAVDTTVAGSFVVNGTIDLSATKFVNTDSVAAVANVEVVDLTTIEWAAYADQANAVEYGVNWTTVYTDRVLASKNGVVIKALADATSDAGHAQTAPMVKFNNGKNGVEITIPENASAVTITAYVVTYGGKSGTLNITQNGTTLGTGAVTASSQAAAADSAAAFQAFTPSVVTTTVEARPGAVILTAKDQNLYLTGVVVEAALTEMYELSYDAAEGEGAPKAAEYDKNTSAVVGAAPTTVPAGYEFVGWEDAVGTVYQPGDSIVMTEDVVLTASYKALITAVTVDLSDFTILSAKAAEALAVAGATVESVYGVPATFAATLGDGTTIDVVATFELPNELATATVGEYTLTGTLSCEEYNFATDVEKTVTYKVIILERLATITSINTETVEFELGQDVVLPETVVATVNGVSQPVELPVTWDDSAVDFTVANNDGYDVTGTVEFDPETMELGQGVQATVKVIVYNYEVASVNAISDINIYIGGAAKLPETVAVTYLDRQGAEATAKLAVENWTCANFDASVAATYTFTANVVGTDLYTIATPMTASVNVVVSAYEAASNARSTYFIDAAKNGIAAGNFHGFNISGSNIASAATETPVRGFKGKNMSVVFTLDKPATVKIGYYLNTAKITASFKSADGAVDVALGDTGYYEAALAAGTYTIASVGTGSSFYLNYIIIEDGGSEVFLAKSATETELALPAVPATKTVDGVSYNYYGYTDGTNVYQAGDMVAASADGIAYYAIYASLDSADAAALKVVDGEQIMRFKASLNLLNAEAVKNAVSFTRTASIAATGEAVYAADKATYDVYVDVANNLTDVVKVETAVTIGGKTVETAVTNNSAANIAKAYLEVKDASDATYRFATEDGKYSAFNATEREIISKYIPA